VKWRKNAIIKFSLKLFRNECIFPIWEHLCKNSFGNIQVFGLVMRIAGLELLDKFKTKHADVCTQIDAWICEVEEAIWQKPNDVKRRYPNASILGDKRVVFNIKGNSYRVDTKIAYIQQIVFIKRIGTHAEYSKWEFD